MFYHTLPNCLWSFFFWMACWHHNFGNKSTVSNLSIKHQVMKHDMSRTCPVSSHTNLPTHPFSSMEHPMSPIFSIVGGWTNPSEKYAQVKLDYFPRVRGRNKKKYLKPPTSFFLKSYPSLNWILAPRRDFSICITSRIASSLSRSRTSFLRPPFVPWKTSAPFRRMNFKLSLGLAAKRTWRSSTYPLRTPPRNKGLIAGLIKGNQWSINP